ncbi:hypothetical protein [Vibrio sp. ER1A]|uniref:hypothetical protein n=1 Tax=Vibrio sp. ER1A TaxID=1517681 RepID=UPI0004DD4FBD|nr:hypothetical protein [Vibrio sp. ER1A]KFA99441.1 hypothetical protein HW45_03505 [Vibrio sp. ER1A]
MSVFTTAQLLVRYSVLSNDGESPLSARTLHRWREKEGYPDPIRTRPQCVFMGTDVLGWEKGKGYTFLPGHANDEQQTEVH